MHRIVTRLMVLCSMFLPLPFANGASNAVPPSSSRMIIHADRGRDAISKNIYGHFSEHLGRCIYEGIWVGEGSAIPNTRGIRNDVVGALKRIQVPVLRWPGGCFADEYHWKDGIGPRDKRPAMINTHWGGVVENNHFGTHEFMDFCEQIGAAPCVCGNVGSGTVQELMEWVEYMTSDADSPMANLRRSNGREKPWKLPYLAIGNENWGCGGNMRPEFYADNFLRYNTFVKNYPGNQVYRIACGANDGDYHWTDVLMNQVGQRMNGLSLHYYTITTGDWQHKGSATQFSATDWFKTLRQTLKMEDLVARHSSAMDKKDPQKRVGLIVDEWGTWHDPEPGTNPGFLYQQNTLRDALTAATTLNIFNNHCDRVKMANIAQLINVLQAMILTDHEKMIVTPTYHVFEMYTVHHDATLLPMDLQSATYAEGADAISQINASASRDSSGKIHITVCNLSPDKAGDITCELRGTGVKKISGRILTADSIAAHNTFEHPDVVKPAPFTDLKVDDKGWQASVPARSLLAVELE